MNSKRAAILIAALSLSPCGLRAQSGATTPLPISFTGEVRQRSDWDRPAGASADLATYLRSRLGVRAAPTANLSFFLQVQDSRVYGAESNVGANAPDQFDVHQAYAQVAGAHGASVLSLRAGRQEIAFGNERLVGASNWTNTGRSFDGVLFSMAPSAVAGRASTSSAWTLNAFAATIDERGRRVGAPGAAGNRNDHQAIGAYSTHPLGSSAVLDGTLLYDIGGQFRAFDRANRATGDLRVRMTSASAVRVEVEGAYQLGTQRYAPAIGAPTAQQVRAWLFGARVGTPQRQGSRANVTAGVDVLSGDASPGNGTYSAFNTMYATNHPFYGLLDLFTDPASRTNDAGLVDGFIQGNWQAAPKYGLHAELHRFGAQEHAAGAATGPLGWEGDLNLPYTLVPGVTVEGGYSLFRAGTGAAGLTLGTPGQLHHWAYIQLRASF